MKAKNKVDFRIDSETLALIDNAVEVLGTNRTQFMVEVAKNKAEEVLLDRKIYFLDEADIDYINNPNPKADPILVELFERKKSWD
ncbi:MAG: DUF1778 domain-containing protein [Cyanobacteria bacterium P01_G01_bin.19]